jgi:NADH:ubiquinone oxidoreductase subunit 4 (subunit M)
LSFWHADGGGAACCRPNGSLAVLVAGVFFIGVYPGPLFEIADNVTRFLFL